MYSTRVYVGMPSAARGLSGRLKFMKHFMCMSSLCPQRDFVKQAFRFSMESVLLSPRAGARHGLTGVGDEQGGRELGEGRDDV